MRQYKGFNVCDKGKVTVIVNGVKYVGKWVFGFYVYEPQGIKEHQIFTGEYDKQLDKITFEVIPETVSQEIGRKDISGKPIFEGNKCDVTLNDGTIEKFVVTYIPKKAGNFFVDENGATWQITDINIKITGTIFDLEEAE